MVSKKVLVLLILWGSLLPHCCYAGRILFGSRNSAINVTNSANFNIASGLTNNGGKIARTTSATIAGNDILFNKGVFENANSEFLITGTYKPKALDDQTGTSTLRLQGSAAVPHRFRAEAGTEIDLLQVAGSHNRIEGLPTFKNPITFDDANTTMTISIKSVLNQNIVMNGGKLVLEDNLDLADDVELVGTGTVDFNGRQLTFGGKDLAWTGSCYWKDAGDIILKSNVDLSGTWTFEGECYLNGDSVLVDLSHSGTIWIRPNSAVYITQLKIKGLGDQPGMGNIYFEDDTSRLHLRRAALELTTTYTINTGQVIVEVGGSKIVTRDKILWLTGTDGQRLQVNGVNFYYDTRTFSDNKNIQPNRSGVGTPITISGNGSILNNRTFQRFTSDTSADGELGENRFLGDGGSGATLTLISTAPEFDGKGWYIHFSRNPLDGGNILKQLAVDTDVHGILKHIVLKDFLSKYVLLRSGATLLFGDKTTIELGADEDLQTTWTFEGECIIDGRDKVLNITGGGIDIQNNVGEWGKDSSLLLKNMTIKGLSDYAIRCMDDTATITFQNVKLLLSDFYTFSTGHFEILNDVKVCSNNSSGVRFIYGTNGITSKICSGAQLHFDRNTTFSYAPLTSSKTLLEFEDATSELSLNGATLFATTTGLQLTKGTLLIDHKCTISNDATNIYEATVFGDGTLANDLNITVLPGGSIYVARGYLDYQNVEQ